MAKIKDKIKKNLIQNRLFAQQYVMNKGVYYRQMLKEKKYVFKPIKAEVAEVYIQGWDSSGYPCSDFHFIMFKEYLPEKKNDFLILEARTGLQVATGISESQAIANAKEKLDKFAKTGERFEELVGASIRVFGLSPCFYINNRKEGDIDIAT